ncbi:MAG: hypothetical protein KKA07_14480 [Bacteroidetes bacterium]|nr:hypothetical protein [Bacteroidota bacterium]MBU1720267.1 hypothetical protein [Bacteroidota bacterium]
MTAVLGILNKQAVAIAADSAVTIGGSSGHKIFNRANKVFALSKRHPVGIMLYNSATFLSTPWETIIKVYRKQLADKSFPRLNDYIDDFIIFLHSKNHYTSLDIQKVFFVNFSLNIINSIIEDIAKSNKTLFESPTEENKMAFRNLLEEQLNNVCEFWNNQKACPEFEKYSIEMFQNFSNDAFHEVIKNRFIENGITVSVSIIEKFRLAVYRILVAQENRSNFTGLVFVGFGEEEIYPQLMPVNVSFVFDNRLRYYYDIQNSAIISDSNNGAVRPFAQTDVIDTILSGIDPNLNNTFLENFGELFKKYNLLILEKIGETNPSLSAQIQALNTQSIIDEYSKMNQQILKENYIIPLMNAVSHLSKEDLAEMAESLIYLTYLKRRITNAEESVGGPIDVAIISKGDGFIWIKRKHYFKPELNASFFDNYLKI